MKPSSVLVLYEGGGQFHALQHDLCVVDETYTLKAGKSVSLQGLQRALLTMAKTQSGMRQFGFLDGHVLAVGFDKMAWWCPSQRRTVFLKTNEGQVLLNFVQPSLVFCAQGRELCIAAVTGNTRPLPDDVVYEAPYYNVWTGGCMCVGNVELPGETITARIKAWEEAFFSSWFTHPNARGLVNFEGDLPGLWRFLGENGSALDAFPESVLVAMGDSDAPLTVAQFVGEPS